MERYSFFNDINDDRVYFAEDFARHLAKYFTNGIFNNELQVLSNDDMSVILRPGSANINGYRYDNDQQKILTIENADGVLNRIDNIVVRLDLVNRDITTQVIKGSFADEPIAPSLVRTSTIYDLRIAKISVPAGTTTITQDLIIDTRFITNDCGVVTSTVQTLDTTDVYNQLYTRYENLMQQNQKEFLKWFSEIKNLLDSDVGGSLARHINTIVDNGLRSYSKILAFENWVLNEESSLYEYDITDDRITSNTLVNGNLDIINQVKLNNACIDSYDGGFKIYTTEKPAENIDITITYQTSNLSIGVD